MERYGVDTNPKEVLHQEFPLAELGISGPACVLAIEPCPEIESGRGRVITGTFTTARCQYLDLRLVGSDEVLHPTPSHRFFSLDRGDYVPAEELRPGERLRARRGQAAAVESLRLNPEPERVYNLEIEGEHNYFVGELGVLVHNACAVKTENGYDLEVNYKEGWSEEQIAQADAKVAALQAAAEARRVGP